MVLHSIHPNPDSGSFPGPSVYGPYPNAIHLPPNLHSNPSSFYPTHHSQGIANVTGFYIHTAQSWHEAHSTSCIYHEI